MATIDWAEIREQTLKDFTLAALPPTLKLPSLPHAVTEFAQASNREGVSVKELAGIVETDAGLTVELLKHVNSAFVGMRHKATSVQPALSMLGLRPSRTLLMTTGMKAAVQARKSKLINQSCFWNASLQKALFAKEVARLLNADVNLAFLGSLLQDYLLPVVTNELFEPYLRFVETRSDQPIGMWEFEQQTFGWDHAYAGASLAHRWKLPDDLVCCILFHHMGLRILTDKVVGRSAVAAVAISAMLPDQLRQNYRGLEQLAQLAEKWPAFNLQELTERVDEQHGELAMGVRNDFPLSRRCRTILEKSGAESHEAYNDGSLATCAST